MPTGSRNHVRAHPPSDPWHSVHPLTRARRIITISITAPKGAIEQDLLTIDVGQEITIADLKAVIQGDTNVDPLLQTLFHNSVQLLDDSKTLEQCQIQEDAMLGMLVRPTEGDASSASHGRSRGGQPPDRAPPARGREPQADVETIRLQALGDQKILATIRSQNPELADAVPDQRRFHQVWHDMHRHQRDTEAKKQRELALLNADPFNEETQKKIEEIIREERVMENVQNAVVYNPEGPTVPFSISPPTRLTPRISLTHHPPAQSSVACTCSTSPSKSTTTRSKPSSTPAPKPPSCRPAVRNPAASCG